MYSQSNKNFDRRLSLKVVLREQPKNRFDFIGYFSYSVVFKSGLGKKVYCCIRGGGGAVLAGYKTSFIVEFWTNSTDEKHKTLKIHIKPLKPITLKSHTNYNNFKYIKIIEKTTFLDVVLPVPDIDDHIMLRTNLKIIIYMNICITIFTLKSRTGLPQKY